MPIANLIPFENLTTRQTIPVDFVRCFIDCSFDDQLAFQLVIRVIQTKGTTLTFPYHAINRRALNLNLEPEQIKSEMLRIYLHQHSHGKESDKTVPPPALST